MIDALKRTTIVVNDIEASIKFYQEALGLKLARDNILTDDKIGSILNVPGAEVRMVVLQCEEQEMGMVGLLSFKNPELKPRKFIQETGITPDVMILFFADGIEALYNQVRDSGGQIITPPNNYEIPEKGDFSGFTCLDPNGVVVSVQSLSHRDAKANQPGIRYMRASCCVVTDIEKSVDFYQNILGMKSLYDQTFGPKSGSGLMGMPDATIRFRVMQSGNADVGLIGLVETQDPVHQPRRKIQSISPSVDTCFIIPTDDIHSVFEKIENSDIRVLCPPFVSEMPGGIDFWEMSCLDPDDIMLEIYSMRKRD